MGRERRLMCCCFHSVFYHCLFMDIRTTSHVRCVVCGHVTRGRKRGPAGRSLLAPADGKNQDTSPAQRQEAKENKKNKTKSMETREGARRSADKQQRRRRK